VAAALAIDGPRAPLRLPPRYSHISWAHRCAAAGSFLQPLCLGLCWLGAAGGRRLVWCGRAGLGVWQPAGQVSMQPWPAGTLVVCGCCQLRGEARTPRLCRHVRGFVCVCVDWRAACCLRPSTAAATATNQYSGWAPPTCCCCCPLLWGRHHQRLRAAWGRAVWGLPIPCGNHACACSCMGLCRRQQQRQQQQQQWQAKGWCHTTRLLACTREHTTLRGRQAAPHLGSVRMPTRLGLPRPAVVGDVGLGCLGRG
jgi:hypothetical protein